MHADHSGNPSPAHKPSPAPRGRLSATLLLVLARFNQRLVNPVVRSAAGRLPGMAVVHHTGRGTGRASARPVRVFRTAGAFYVMIANGRTPDWLRNLEAANGGELRVRGQSFGIGRPRPADVGEALTTGSRFSRTWRRTLGLTEGVALVPVAAGADFSSATHEHRPLPVAPPGPCQAMIEMYLLMHRTFRDSAAELVRTTAMLADRPAADPLRAQALQRWYAGFEEEILVHHSVEDTLLFPTMEARVPAEYATYGPTLHADHAELDVILASLRAALSGRDYAVAAPLAVRLHGHLDGHLDFEDRHVVPLLVEHLTAADRKVVTRQAWKFARPRQALFTVPWLLSPLDPLQRAEVAAKVPFKGMSFAWTVTRRRYTRLAAMALG